MSDGPDSVVLVYLRRLDERQARMEEDLRDVKRRLASIEEGNANLFHSYAGIQLRLDRIEARVERLERRLDLTEVAR